MEQRELSSQLNFSPTWRGGFNFKGRSEVNDGEVHTLVYWGRGKAFLRELGGDTVFILFWSLMYVPAFGRCVI